MLYIILQVVAASILRSLHSGTSSLSDGNKCISAVHAIVTSVWTVHILADPV
jgi:hypothetical protein